MSQITKFFRAANKHAPMRSAQGGALGIKILIKTLLLWYNF